MGLDLDFDLLLEKMELVAAGGISPFRTDPDLVMKTVVYVKKYMAFCLGLFDALTL